MKKREAQYTTELFKALDQRNISANMWAEAKVVPRPRRFSTKVLSKKAKTMLGFSKLKHKFSDIARMGTPLDFVYLTSIDVYLCVIFYAPKEKKSAYFMKYKSVSPDGGDTLLTESECSDRSVFVIDF